MRTQLHVEAYAAMTRVHAWRERDQNPWAKFTEEHRRTPADVSFGVLLDLAWDAATRRGPMFTLTITGAHAASLVTDRTGFDRALPCPLVYAPWELDCFANAMCEWSVCAGCARSHCDTLLGALMNGGEPHARIFAAYPLTDENAARLAAALGPLRLWGVCWACRKLRCAVCGRGLSAVLAQPKRARALHSTGQCEQCTKPGLGALEPHKPTSSELRALAQRKLAH